MPFITEVGLSEIGGRGMDKKAPSSVP